MGGVRAATWALLVLVAPVAAGSTWEPAAPSLGTTEDAVGVYDSTRQELVVLEGEGYYYERQPTALWRLDGSGFHLGPTPPPELPIAPMVYDAARSRIVLVSGETTWEFDGSSWSAGMPPRLPQRAGFAIAYDAARQLVVLYGGSAASRVFDETWEYDGSTWRQGPSGPMGPRSGAAMAYDAALGRIVLFGGAGMALNDDTWVYDGTAWTEVVAPLPRPPARRGHGMTWDGIRGRTIVVGGRDGTAFLRDTWFFDGAAWTAGAPAPAAFAPEDIAVLAHDALRDRAVLIAGPEHDVWEHDGTVWSLASAAPQGVKARQSHAMAYDAPRARAVLFGGWNGSPLDDTWELSGSTWVKGPTAPPALTARYAHAMTFDRRLGRVLLVGGWDGAARNDVWVYDGASWQPGPAPPPALAPRKHLAMTHDSSRGRTVLYGGDDVAAIHADTWLLDAAGWSLGPSGPGPLTAHAMTYDPVRGEAVLAGGWNGVAISRETWELAASWSRTATQGPALVEQAMTFDPTSGAVVLSGGHLGGGQLSDTTWYYDNHRWTPVERAYSHAGVERARHAMVLDESRGGPVIFGGAVGTNGTHLGNDAWELRPRGGIVAGPGPDPINGNRITVMSSGGSPTSIDTFAYSAGAYGTTAGAGNLEGSSLHEVLTGPGPSPSLGPQVRAFRPEGGAPPIAKVNFYAYGTLKWGVNPGASNVDGDAYSEILAAPGPGQVFGPHVRGFDYDGVALSPIAGVSFFAYATLRFGAQAAGGDVDRDGYGEVLTGPGPGPTFGAQVRGFDVDGAPAQPIPGLDFFAFATTHGVLVASGEADGDPRDEIACGMGPSPAAPIAARGFELQGASVTALPGFDATWVSNYGARVALADHVGDDVAELAVGFGPGPGFSAGYTVFRYEDRRMTTVLWGVEAFPGAGYGINVAGGSFGR